jgi:hypothetical protein
MMALTRNSLVRFGGALFPALTFAVSPGRLLGYHVTGGDRDPVHARCESTSLAHSQLMFYH